jgi:hypothetical protein
MRRILFLTAILVFANLSANAQNSPASNSSPPAASSAAPSTTGIAPSSAPVGHRQPKLSDLPQDLADRQKADAQQDTTKRAEDEFDKRRLKICSGC